MTHASTAVVVLLLLTACGEGTSAAPAPAPRASPAPTSTSAAPAVAPPLPPAPPSPSAPPLPSPPSGPRYGDVMGIEDDAGEIVASFLLIEAEGVPPRAGEPIGTAYLHGGAWSFDALQEVESPYAEAWMIGGPCRARVTAARWVRGTFSGHDAYNDRDAMFLGLSVDGCGGQWGVVGVEPRYHALDPSELPAASTELAARIRALDAEQEPAREGWGFSPPRAFEVPGQGLAVVFGNDAYAVRGDQVAFAGDVMAVIDAPPYLLLQMSSPSEAWLQPVDDLAWSDGQEASERRQK